MRPVILIAICGSLLVALLALVGAAEPRVGDLEDSIARMVVATR